MSKFLPIAILFFLEILGCQNPKFRVEELAGTWVMTGASRPSLPPELQQASAKIVLNVNGTFVASNMPGLLYIPPSRPRMDSGSGVWTLVSRDGEQHLQLNFRFIADSNQSVPFGTQVSISRGRSVPTLYYFLGDADEGRRIEFERK